MLEEAQTLTGEKGIWIWTGLWKQGVIELGTERGVVHIQVSLAWETKDQVTSLKFAEDLLTTHRFKKIKAQLQQGTEW
jgi:hypothetical protein